MLHGFGKECIIKMKQENEQVFGEYAEMLRKQKGKSLRETAKAIGVSAQFYSEIEKGRRSALTPERLEKFKAFIGLNSEETETLYNKAAEARKRSEFDFSDYIIQRDYAMSALRVAKELDADEEDWQRFIDELKQRKE
jgi:transcriptional regulator with XRE-family HTH domain